MLKLSSKMQTSSFLAIIYFSLALHVPTCICGSYGYHCIGNNNGNLYLKCTVRVCNGTPCETIVEYLDMNGPNAILDSNLKLNMDLIIENATYIHVLFISNILDSNSNNQLYRLTKPIILKIEFEEPEESYDLRFINYVNGGPTEEVINKQTRENYFGCDSGKEHPTCGMMYYDFINPVPFSEGFCCSCVDSVNAERQPKSSGMKPNYIDNISALTKKKIQPRSEQDCSNISASPSYVNSVTYHESSHCFRYSDLWFNVYKVEKTEPLLPLELKTFEIDEKSLYELQPELTSSKFADDKQIISKDIVSYQYEINGLNEMVTNNLTKKFILIPHDILELYRQGHPHYYIDEPGMYLVVDPSWMSKNGRECDKIGVEPQAFYEQPDRCDRPRGSCLGGRQPINFLREAEADAGLGRRRRRFVGERLFVKDYVQSGRIRYDDDSKRIIVDRSDPVDSAYGVSVNGNVQIRLDDNGALSDRVLLQISEIHAVFDDVYDTDVNVWVYVTNLALRTAEYLIGVYDLDTRDNRRKAIVHPQQTSVNRFKLECHADQCDATVRLYDGCSGGPAVATRTFGVVRGSRCYCLWHMRCQCYDMSTSTRWPYGGGDGDGILNQTEYGSAGFPGDVPPGMELDAVIARDRMMFDDSLHYLIWLIFATLALGLLKAASPYRKHWIYLWTSDRQIELHRYMEPELRMCELTQDKRGNYLHPTTGSRNIQLLDPVKEFFVNIVFFFLLPSILLRYRMSSSDFAVRY